jgi:hypothetical protein
VLDIEFDNAESVDSSVGQRSGMFTMMDDALPAWEVLPMWKDRQEGVMYHTYQNRLRGLEIHKSIYTLGKEIMLVSGFDGIDYYNSG